MVNHLGYFLLLQTTKGAFYSADLFKHLWERNEILTMQTSRKLMVESQDVHLSSSVWRMGPNNTLLYFLNTSVPLSRTFTIT